MNTVLSNNNYPDLLRFIEEWAKKHAITGTLSMTIKSGNISACLADIEETVNEDAMCFPIKSLGLSARQYRHLERFQFVGALIRASERDLLCLKDFGKKSLLDVIEKLASLNLILGTNYSINPKEIGLFKQLARTAQDPTVIAILRNPLVEVLGKEIYEILYGLKCQYNKFHCHIDFTDIKKNDIGKHIHLLQNAVKEQSGQKWFAVVCDQEDPTHVWALFGSTCEENYSKDYFVVSGYRDLSVDYGMARLTRNLTILIDALN